VSAPDVSVIVSTYNRAATLRSALRSLLAQDAGEVRYEVVIVDNNSQDETRHVVATCGRGTASRLAYLFEPRQGVSYGRNTGIAAAGAPILAFTDDDVVVASDWVRAIKRVFDAHPEIAAAGGKVLPPAGLRWPAWLTRDHWSPLALVDLGHRPLLFDARWPVCLLTANLSFRREVFDRVGRFAPEVQRVRDGIGSMEDHELLMRLYRSGELVLYAPDLQVYSDVTPERLTKAYHRRWHSGHGRFYAIVRDETVEQSDARLFGIPGHMLRASLGEGWAWLAAMLRGRPAAAFLHEVQLRFLFGYFRERRKQFITQGSTGTLRELAGFVGALSKRRRAPRRAAETAPRWERPS
jgi:glycosyltransferase involved in cell wall biosynthesis